MHPEDCLDVAGRLDDVVGIALVADEVLTHRAGIPSLPREAFDLDLLADHEWVEAMVCDLRRTAGVGGET